MSLPLKIPIFLAFLLAYAAFTWLAVLILRIWSRDILESKTLLGTELLLLHSIGGLFGFVWILSGYFNLYLFAVFLAASQLGVVLSGLLWSLFGSPPVPWGARVVWAEAEFRHRRMHLQKAVNLFSMLLFVGYPVAAGVLYFRLDVPSHGATLTMIKVTVLGLFLTSSASLLPAQEAILISERLDRDTRDKLFVNYSSGLVPTALMLSLVLWSFEIVGQDRLIAAAGLPLSSSPRLLASLVGFYTLAVLVPYLAGTQRARRWREHLLTKEEELLDRALDVLEFPTPSRYRERLEELGSMIAREREEFLGREPLLAELLVHPGPDSPEWENPGVKALVTAFRSARHLDARVRFLSFLDRLEGKIEEAIGELEGDEKEEVRIQKAQLFARAFRHGKAEIDDAREAEKGGRPVVAAALAFLFSPVIGGVLGKVGELIWTTAGGAAGP